MAKNRNTKGKNKRNSDKDGAVSMDVSTEIASDAPQPMDTAEGKRSISALGGAIKRKGIKAVPLKRSKNTRKIKRIARAIVTSEKNEEKETKRKSKVLRVQSAKSLYD